MQSCTESLPVELVRRRPFSAALGANVYKQSWQRISRGASARAEAEAGFGAAGGVRSAG